MPTITVGAIDYEYQTNPPHRNGAENKSQWTVQLPEEYGCFEGALAHGYRLGAAAWGFYRPNGHIEQLGLDRDHASPCFIARFEAKNGPEVWHGYPIGRQDPPAQEILRTWLDNDILPAAKIAKIAGRRRCSL